LLDNTVGVVVAAWLCKMESPSNQKLVADSYIAHQSFGENCKDGGGGGDGAQITNRQKFEDIYCL